MLALCYWINANLGNRNIVFILFNELAPVVETLVWTSKSLQFFEYRPRFGDLTLSYLDEDRAITIGYSYSIDGAFQAMRSDPRP
ncbi:hypothetical protein C8J46_10614 [Sphingomonas sp. PP-F2F-A104-K0414]|nr:hypothetical protein C8J46_10614 [Sphingomonas sp. PP-F2F-A104-K0414]